jgi:hypothetical protein
MTVKTTSLPPARHAGPHLGVLAIVFTLLFSVGLYFVTDLAGKSHFPSPLQPPQEVIEYFRSRPSSALLCAFLQFGSAVPLALFTATAVSRLRFLGVRAAGTYIALYGGFAASFNTMASTLFTWSLVQPGIADDAVLTRALHFLTFAFGGPGYSVPLGLFIAGISIPALFLRLLPRWLAIFGLVLAVVGELSWLSLIIPNALFLIPLTRFPAFVWLIVVGFKLPRSRTDLAEAKGQWTRNNH